MKRQPTYRSAKAATDAMKFSPVVKQSIVSQDWVQKVMAFHQVYQVPVQAFGSTDNSFNHMLNERVGFRLGLVIEEFKEMFKDGFGIDVDINFTVPPPVTNETFRNPFRHFNEAGVASGLALGYAEDMGLRRDGTKVADAAGDIIYVLLGLMIEMGFDMRSVMDEIHAANMTKLGSDGLPIFREDGKVMKGPNYRPANIRYALEMNDYD